MRSDAMRAKTPIFRLLGIASAVMIGLALAAPGRAQLNPTGRVLGTVKDQSGAVVPNAAITLTNIETGISRSTVSNARGEYLFPAAPAGTYRISAAVHGFQHVTRELTVQAAVSTTVDMTLQIGQAKQVVQVSAPAPLLNTDSGTLATVVNNRQISNLPLQGRNPLMLVQLTAGIVQTVNPGPSGVDVNAMNQSSYFTSNGANFRQNDFMIDGIPDNLTDRVQYIPPVSQLQEFSVISNSYDAQYGHGGGAYVVMVTKSGTNHFHGSAYEFLQNDAFNAGNFFSNRAGLAKPPVRYNQFGAAIGGPIRRDRTFFFFNYEGIRSQTPSTQIGTVPTAAQRTGDFSQTFDSKGQLIQIFNPYSTIPNPAQPGHFVRTAFPGNEIPLSAIDAASKGLLSLIPEPNRAGLAVTGAQNYAKTVISSTPMNDVSIRVDDEITQNNHLFARFSREKTDTIPGTFIVPTRTEHTQQFNTGIGLTSTLNPTTVLDFRAGWEGWEDDNVTPRANLASLGFSPSFVSSFGSQYIPNFNIGDMSSFGNGPTQYDHDPTWAFNVNLRHLHGRNDMKWGFQTQVKQDNAGSLGAAATFNFDRQFTQGPDPINVGPSSGYGIASFLLGAMSPTQQSFVQSVSTQATTAPYYGAYFQDDIRVTPKLTLNAGLRWEAWQPATERFNAQIVGFAFNTPNPIQGVATANYTLHPVPQLSVDQFSDEVLGGLIYATPSHRRWGRTVWNNWSPRFGFAYRIGTKTVLRGGFGTFYSMFWTTFTRQSGFSAITPATATIDGITPVDLLNDPFPGGFIQPTGSSLGLETQLGSSVGFLSPTVHPGYNSRWNFGVQRQITANTMLEVYYVGETAFHLPVGSTSQTPVFSSAGPSEADRQFGYLPPQYLSLGSQLFTTVPNPFLGLIPSASPLGKAALSLGSLLSHYPEFTGVDESRATDGRDYYHALQATVTKRYSYGLTLLGTYTWSKSLDRYRFINPSDPGPSKMIGQYDAPQRFTLAGVYQLPVGPGRTFGWKKGLAGKLIEGWQFDVSGTFQSGFPTFLSTPVVIASGVDPTLSTGRRSVNDWFNLAALKPLPPFTLSSAPFGLNSLRSDAIDNWDMSLIKDTKFHENITLQFRWEVFNAFNRPQFADPNVNPSSTAYGTISSQANQPRTMQFGLELLF